MSPIRPRPVLAILLHLGIMLGAILLNWIMFPIVTGQQYFSWYFKNGFVISLATGFLALIWKDMKSRLGLISSHPSAYFAAAFQLVGVFVYSLGSTKRSEPRVLPFDIGLNYKLAEILDNVFYTLLALVMIVLCLGWLLVVAPLGYFVTLIAGAPARQELRGKLATTNIHEQGTVQILSSADTPELLAAATPVSIARDPFAVTQATSAVILWIANLVYSRFG